MCEKNIAVSIISNFMEVCCFIPEKEGKAMHLSYADKLKFVALTKQVAHGKCRPEASTEVGFLDVVGNDRR